MILLLSQLQGVSYRRVIKPIIFRQPPDAVHDRMIRSAHRLQRAPGFRRMAHTVMAYDNSSVLGQTIHGIQFKNPVGLSAGLDKNFAMIHMLEAIGFGFMEGGSITYKPCDGNPRPWFHRLPKTKSLVVHVGLANQGVEQVIQNIQAYDSLPEDFPLNVSVARTNTQETCTDEQGIADYVGSLKHIQAAGIADLITINISCPNTYGGEPFTRPEALEALLTAIDGLHVSQPVFLKMPGDLSWDRFSALVDIASKHHIQGLTIHNLAKDRTRIKLADPLPDGIKGNLSGKPTWETSNELIRKTRKKYGKRFTIIGVGGIFSAEDAYTKIRLGADMVELITGMIFEGPSLIGQINRGLAHLLVHDGYTNISQAVGVDVDNT